MGLQHITHTHTHTLPNPSGGSTSTRRTYCLSSRVCVCVGCAAVQQGVHAYHGLREEAKAVHLRVSLMGWRLTECDFCLIGRALKQVVTPHTDEILIHVSVPQQAQQICILKSTTEYFTCLSTSYYYCCTMYWHLEDTSTGVARQSAAQKITPLRTRRPQSMCTTRGAQRRHHFLLFFTPIKSSHLAVWCTPHSTAGTATSSDKY